MENNKLKFCVYKITNSISGKSYIGKTCDLKIRWRDHLRKSKNKNLNNKFPNALKKYPEDSWDIFILYETNDEDHCYEVEEILIEEYDTFHNGYNSCGGGNGIGSGENSPNFGKSHSEEFKKNRSNAMLGENNPNFGKRGENSPIFGTLPWNTALCKSKGLQINWFYLDKVYDLRIKYGYGQKRIYDILVKDHPDIKKSPTSFQNMFRWIEKNGNPSKHHGWLKFKNEFIT